MRETEDNSLSLSTIRIAYHLWLSVPGSVGKQACPSGHEARRFLLLRWLSPSSGVRTDHTVDWIDFNDVTTRPNRGVILETAFLISRSMPGQLPVGYRWVRRIICRWSMINKNGKCHGKAETSSLTCSVFVKWIDALHLLRCVQACVCVCARETEREKKVFVDDWLGIYLYSASVVCHFTSSTLCIGPDTPIDSCLQSIATLPRGLIPIKIGKRKTKWRHISCWSCFLLSLGICRSLSRLSDLLDLERGEGEETRDNWWWFPIISLIWSDWFSFEANERRKKSTCAQYLSSFSGQRA